MPHTYDHPHPAVTTDIVIFTIRAGALKVLLIKRALAPLRGQWALPGGFVEMGEAWRKAPGASWREKPACVGCI